MNDNTQFNLDSLLDGTLDDLADLPEYRPFIPGVYKLNFSLEADAKDKSIYYARLKVKEVREQADPTETPMEIGAETSVRYDLKNEYGQGAFKKILIAAAGHFGKKSNRELMAELQNVEVLAVTSSKTNKKNGQTYTDIVELGFE